MILKRALAAVFATLLAPVAFAQPPQATKPTFLILGSFHFQGSTADLMSNHMPDVQSEKRQREMEAVADALARFKPTKVAVEVPAGNTKVQEQYQAYLKGGRQLAPDETEQIAFRLAKKLGHDRIHPVDHKLDMDFEGLMKAVEKNGQQAYFEQAMVAGKAYVDETQRLIDTANVGAALRFMNDPKQIDAGHGAYMLMAQVGTPDDPKGAEVVAGWYRRNLLIYSNLVRLIDKSEERVLLVIGAGHAKLLRDAIAQSPNLRLEEAVDYLP
jgi:uncharacterized protein DUF5694